MNKIFPAVLVASLFALQLSSPATAMEKMKCNANSMHKVEMMMKEKGADKNVVKMAMKENEMAAMSKKNGKMKDCAMHLNMAADHMMMHK